MRARIIIAVVAVLASLSGQAQRILLEADPAIDSTKSRFGANRKYYELSYFYLGYYWDKAEPGADISRLLSYNLGFGQQFKIKIAEPYSIWFNLGFSNDLFTIKQNANKTLPDTVLHKRERLSWWNGNVGFFNRFHFTKRGDSMGLYADLGGDVSYTFSHQNFSFDKQDGARIRTRIKGLDYYNPFQYRAIVRFGNDLVCLQASYRFSDLFYSNQNLPELPRLNIALFFNAFLTSAR